MFGKLDLKLYFCIWPNSLSMPAIEPAHCYHSSVTPVLHQDAPANQNEPRRQHVQPQYVILVILIYLGRFKKIMNEKSAIVSVSYFFSCSTSTGHLYKSTHHHIVRPVFIIHPRGNLLLGLSKQMHK